MIYDASLIRTDGILCADRKMYSVILLSARALTLTLNGSRHQLTGKYMLCLSVADTAEIVSGDCDVQSIRFLPCFINIKLSHELLGQPLYMVMRMAHKYPDFHLFREHGEAFDGILALTENEYEIANGYFERVESYLANHASDRMWSCHARCELFSLMNIAESAFRGRENPDKNDIVRYLKVNAYSRLTLSALSTRFSLSQAAISDIVYKKTGLSPMAYVTEERLTQVLPDLLFTNVPVSALSARFGFSDTAEFVRAFERKYGKPPGQYRDDGLAARLRSQKSNPRKEKDSLC